MYIHLHLRHGTITTAARGIAFDVIPDGRPEEVLQLFRFIRQVHFPIKDHRIRVFNCGLIFPSHDIDVVHDYVQAHYKGRFGEEGTGRKRGWSEEDVRRLVQPAELLHADEAAKRRIHAQGRHQIDACQGRDRGVRYFLIIKRSVVSIAPVLLSSLVAPACSRIVLTMVMSRLAVT